MVRDFCRILIYCYGFMYWVFGSGNRLVVVRLLSIGICGKIYFISRREEVLENIDWCLGCSFKSIFLVVFKCGDNLILKCWDMKKYLK